MPALPRRTEIRCRRDGLGQFALGHQTVRRKGTGRLPSSGSGIYGPCSWRASSTMPRRQTIRFIKLSTVPAMATPVHCAC
jgi:hypothetical protein